MDNANSYWLKTNTILNNRYKIVHLIGEGGMGNIYLGIDTLLDSYVSIKEFFPQRLVTRVDGTTQIRIFKGDAETIFQRELDKFINEAKILAKYEAIRSIVMVKDFFYANETAYIVMEHIDGQDIKSYVDQNGPMEAEQVLRIMKPILEALSTLHKENLIHRDISPDNILLREDGMGVLIDFGAARFSDIQETKTMTVFFKRGYSAEEQYAEKSEKGPYTDIYSICATMYFMLTGKKPDESIRRLIHDRVVPLTKYSSIPLSLAQKRAIMKGMNVDSTKRFKTIDDFCKALYDAPKHPITNRYIASSFVLVGLVSILGINGALSTGNKDSSSGVPPQKKQMAHMESPAPTEAPVIQETKEVAITATPVTIQIVPKVIGKKSSSAKKLLKRKLNSPKIKIVKKYSSDIKATKVIKQSISAGKQLSINKKPTITLTVSLGKKPTPKPTQKPVTRRKSSSKKKSGKKKNSKKYSGKLPW